MKKKILLKNHEIIKQELQIQFEVKSKIIKWKILMLLKTFFSTISFVLYQFDENSKWKLSSSSSSPNWIESKNYQDVYCKDCGRSKFICGWLIHHRHYHYQEKLTCVGVIIHKHKHIYILKNNFGIFLRFMKKNAGILMYAYLSLRRKCEKKTFDCFCVCVCVAWMKKS